MIVSHKHKFIFVHLGRTAGRALTTMLAEHCGEDDIITPVGDIARNNAGYRRHLTAQQIRAKIGKDRFEEYFKFTIERNPWEKIISRYRSYIGNHRQSFYKNIPYMLLGDHLTFATWFEMRIWYGRTIGFGHYKLPRHYDCYMENDRMIVDFIGRQENLDEHVAMIADRLNLKLTPPPVVGRSPVARDKPYTEMYDERMRRVVDKVYAKDMEYLGYRFGEAFPKNAIFRDEPATV